MIAPTCRTQFRWRSRWAAVFRSVRFGFGKSLRTFFGPGTHASTFGGTPLACAVALKIFDVIEKENLAENARQTGEFHAGELQELQQRFPKVIKVVRGLGLMIGIEFQAQFKAVDIVKELHERHLLRFLPELR